MSFYFEIEKQPGTLFLNAFGRELWANWNDAPEVQNWKRPFPLPFMGAVRSPDSRTLELWFGRLHVCICQ